MNLFIVYAMIFVRYVLNNIQSADFWGFSPHLINFLRSNHSSGNMCGGNHISLISFFSATTYRKIFKRNSHFHTINRKSVPFTKHIQLILWQFSQTIFYSSSFKSKMTWFCVLDGEKVREKLHNPVNWWCEIQLAYAYFQLNENAINFSPLWTVV